MLASTSLVGLSLALIALAAWGGTLEVSATVGPEDATWEVFDCRDAGTALDWSALPDASPVPAGWSHIADRVSVNATQYDVLQTNNHVGSSAAAGTGSDTVTVTIGSAYPAYFEVCQWRFRYTGTVPAVVQSLDMTPGNFASFATDIFSMDGPLYVEFRVLNPVPFVGASISPISPGNFSEGELLIRVQQSAAESTTYTFEVKVELVAPAEQTGTPVIECKWELPDMASAVPGIQYISASGFSDDDPNTMPDGDPTVPGPQAPCAGPPERHPGMPDGVRHMIQVAPNPEDEPEQRRIQLWAAVDHPSGLASLGSVYWHIYGPGSSEPVVVHGTRFTECLGPPGMFQAASLTGQLTQAAIEHPQLGIVAMCALNAKALYVGELRLSKHQPCGEYRVELHAVDTNARETILTNYFDVVCMFALRVDFDRVDWHALAPGEWRKVFGDTDFSAPPCIAGTVFTCPTVKNVGNSAMGLRIEAGPMAQVDALGNPVPGGGLILDFGGCFGRDAASIQCIDPSGPADQSLVFDDDPRRTLCSNEVGKLDLLVRAPVGVPPGVYRGAMTFIGKANQVVCPLIVAGE
jgi:hypothetical protein